MLKTIAFLLHTQRHTHSHRHTPGPASFPATNWKQVSPANVIRPRLSETYAIPSLTLDLVSRLHINTHSQKLLNTFLVNQCYGAGFYARQLFLFFLEVYILPPQWPGILWLFSYHCKKNRNSRFFCIINVRFCLEKHFFVCVNNSVYVCIAAIWPG